MTTSITFRTDAELKADVEEILEDIGMNMSTAFNCFMAKIRDVGGIPFTLTPKNKHQRILDAYNEAKTVRRSNPSIRIMRFPATFGGFVIATSRTTGCFSASTPQGVKLPYCIFTPECGILSPRRKKEIHTMFVGRETELEDLAALWRKGTASLVACRGRRRIGKSRLVNEFSRRTGGACIELVGLPPRPDMTNEKQLEAFAAGLAKATHRPVAAPENWFRAFEFLDKAIDNRRRTVVLLDEISWMGGYDPDFPGYLKTAWDTMFSRHDKLVLVLCGSVNAWIKKNILDSTGFVGRFSRDYVLGELTLAESAKFWKSAADRLAPREIFDVLAITGGIPRYLEEIDPGLSADENIRRLCFSPSGTLFKDFNEIFSAVFGDEAVLKRRILALLTDGPQTGEELSERLKCSNNGHFAEHLEALSLAGFISAERGINPATGKRARTGRYRIRDNYTRFYLKYIEPHIVEIEDGSYRFTSLEALPDWHATMGLQFENLIVNHFREIIPHLHIGNSIVVSAAPYRNRRNSRGGGCQIDLLIQTARTAYVVETKRQFEIGRNVEDQVAREMKRLHIRADMSARPVLVYLGQLDASVEGDGFFDAIIPAQKLLK